MYDKNIVAVLRFVSKKYLSTSLHYIVFVLLYHIQLNPLHMGNCYMELVPIVLHYIVLPVYKDECGAQ